MLLKQLSTRLDFIIAGAMKCGTTTLHELLSQHPRIFIPRGEMHLLSIDDIEQFPQASIQGVGRYTHHNFERNFEEYDTWHASHYAEAEAGQILGEDSTTYLASRLAIDRIARYLPETKVLVLLRDPVARVYSQYWHWVRTYRAVYSLEDTIRFQHGNLLQRSYYEEQLRYLFEKLDKSRVKVVLFEEFIRDQRGVLSDILLFLGVEETPACKEAGMHANRGKFPRHPQVALWRNYVGHDLYGRQYRDKLPQVDGYRAGTPVLRRLARQALHVLSRQTNRSPRIMSPEAQVFLSSILFERNAGLPELLGRDLSEFWPTFTETVPA